VRTTPRLGSPQPAGGGRTAAPVAPAIPAPAVPALPKTPSLPPPSQIPDLISNPSTTASQIADAGQDVTDTAGVSVARLSPELGGAVAGAGQTAASTVRQVPLPGHIIPGH
jgi:hypothetical protein